MPGLRTFSAFVLVFASARFTEHSLPLPGKQAIHGATLVRNSLLAWGDGLYLQELPEGAGTLLPAGAVRSAALMDVNGDGKVDVVVNETGGALVWLEAPAWTRHPIDTGVDTADMRPAVLHGRRGVLIVQKRLQVRFYEVPAGAAARWPYRDLYSVYTPSWQGDLHLADIDGDGRPDILCGDYWIRSPRRSALPWRLFAIHTWSEEPPSAMVWETYGPLERGRPPVLVAAQRAMPQARLAWFEKPPDPRALWREHRIAAGLAPVSGVALADFDGHGRADILVSENGGAGRLLVYRNTGGGFTPVVVRQGSPVVRSFAADLNGDGRPDIVVIGPHSISWWENRR